MSRTYEQVAEDLEAARKRVWTLTRELEAFPQSKRTAEELGATFAEYGAEGFTEAYDAEAIADEFAVDSDAAWTLATECAAQIASLTQQYADALAALPAEGGE